MADRKQDCAPSDFIRDNVKRFEELLPQYRQMGEILAPLLQKAVSDMGLYAMVSARTKETASFAEKCLRKRKTKPLPAYQFTDLCGARVVVDNRDAIAPVCEFIEKTFEIDSVNSEDALDRLSESEFGYRSVHYIVSFKPDTADLVRGMGVRLRVDGLDRLSNLRKAVRKLCERRSPEECLGGVLQPGPVYKAEIQVRTLLQHAWATFTHDRLYKSDFTVPRHLMRDANRIAATLEAADDSFANAIQGVESYRNHLGAYMDEDARKEERNILATVRKYDKNNPRLAMKIARLESSLGRKARAAAVLRPFVAAWLKSEQGKALLRNLELMEKSRAGNPDQARQAGIALSRTRDPFLSGLFVEYANALFFRGPAKGENRRKNRDEVRQHLDWAMALDKGNTDAVVSMAETFMETKSAKTALEWYRKAYVSCPSDPRVLEGVLRCTLSETGGLDQVSMMRPSLLEGIAACRRRARAGVYLPDAHYDEGLFHLLLGRPYRALAAYAKAVTLTEAKSETLARTIRRLGHIKEALVKGRDEKAWVAGGPLRELEWVLRFLQAAWFAKQGGASAQKTLKKIRAADLSFLKGKTIVQVAGGCDPRVRQRIEDFRELFQSAFSGFDGAILSGGTAMGVSGLAGAVPIPREFRLAYLPPRDTLPSYALPDDRNYTVMTISDSGFSALSTIQAWVDLLASGIWPGDVRVLGINGGEISAVEYRVALALGARAGVLRESGRAASEICEDPDWKDAAGLLPLPSDPWTLRFFVQPEKPGTLDDDSKDILAEKVHAQYLKDNEAKILPKEPFLRPWAKAPEGVKESNRQQVDHMEAKLARYGYAIRKKEDPADIRPVSFEDHEIEAMAEMEHARWNLERLGDGWRYGEQKDWDKKISPYLVPWNELPEDIKKYDYTPVNIIPGLLAQVGYEVVRRKKKKP